MWKYRANSGATFEHWHGPMCMLDCNTKLLSLIAQRSRHVRGRATVAVAAVLSQPPHANAPCTTHDMDVSSTECNSRLAATPLQCWHGPCCGHVRCDVVPAQHRVGAFFWRGFCNDNVFERHRPLNRRATPGPQHACQTTVNPYVLPKYCPRYRFSSWGCSSSWDFPCLELPRRPRLESCTCWSTWR